MADKEKQERAKKFIAQNRRARFDYFIDEVFEAGIMLFGSEVKSLREGHASVNESFAALGKTENDDSVIMLYNAYIPENQHTGNYFQHETKRPRQLLLRKKEITRLAQSVSRKGTTIVPLSMYFNEKGKVKIELGVARGKKLHDKRETEKERDWQREKAKIMKDHKSE